jgi:WRKY transcription factor 22
VAQVRPEAHQGLPLPKVGQLEQQSLAYLSASRRRRVRVSERINRSHRLLLCSVNRGYYRCSSSKGCAARKQVERSRADPNTFILTFTGEHNHAAPTHRNSLAGTTRHKFPSSAAPQPPPPSVVVGGDAQDRQPSPSPTSTSTAGLSPTTPLRTPSMEEDDEEEEEEDELLVEDMEMAGEDELLFLSTDADADAGAPTSSLFDVVGEPFLSPPWVTAASSAGEPATGAAGAGS